MKVLKSIFLLLAALALVTTFVACDSSSGSADDDKTPTTNPGVTELEQEAILDFGEVDAAALTALQTALTGLGYEGTWSTDADGNTILTIKESDVPEGSDLATVVTAVKAAATAAGVTVTDKTPGKILIVYANGKAPTAAEITEVIEAVFGSADLPAGFSKADNVITIESDKAVADLGETATTIDAFLAEIKAGATTFGAEEAVLEGKNLTIKIPTPVSVPSGSYSVEVVNGDRAATEAELNTTLPNGDTIKEEVEGQLAPGGTWNSNVYILTEAQIQDFIDEMVEYYAAEGAPIPEDKIPTISSLIDMLVEDDPDAPAGWVNPFTKKDSKTIVYDISGELGGGGTPPVGGDMVSVTAITFTGGGMPPADASDAEIIAMIEYTTGYTVAGTYASPTFTLTTAVDFPEALANNASMGYSYAAGILTVNTDSLP